MSTNSLFVDLAAKESATVSGGGRRRTYHGGGQSSIDPIETGTIVNFNLNSYLFGLGAGVAFGNPGLTPDEIQFSWENALSFGTNVSL
ncbi:MAG: hypothetical protein Kow00121_13900 [Elainellaceae cyanobacterium]